MKLPSTLTREYDWRRLLEYRVNPSTPTYCLEASKDNKARTYEAIGRIYQPARQRRWAQGADYSTGMHLGTTNFPVPNPRLVKKKHG